MLHTRSLVFFTVLGLLFAACGTAEPTDSTTTTTSPSTTTNVAVTPTTTPTATTTAPPADTATVTVYYAVGDATDCSVVQGFERDIPVSSDLVLAAFQELVAGPTSDETNQGAGSFFSATTADAVRSLDLTDGLLTIEFVDFRADMNNASTSCGSASLVASLNSTAFEFDDVERVRYSIFGSCNAFYNWLQGECQDQTRTGPVAVDLNVLDDASGSGCTPGTEQLPDGDWFGYVDNASAAHIEFDLACWFSGTTAADAAAEDGEESPPPNDYYVRNSSGDLRTVSVNAAAEVSKLVDAGGPDLESVTYDIWSSEWSNLDYQPGVWITVEGGAIVSIVEQYVP